MKLRHRLDYLTSLSSKGILEKYQGTLGYALVHRPRRDQSLLPPAVRPSIKSDITSILSFNGACSKLGQPETSPPAAAGGGGACRRAAVGVLLRRRPRQSGAGPLLQFGTLLTVCSGQVRTGLQWQLARKPRGTGAMEEAPLMLLPWWVRGDQRDPTGGRGERTTAASSLLLPQLK